LEQNDKEVSMTLIQSMEDLAQAKADALERQQVNAKTKPFHIRVGMASCSLAAGAADTLAAINQWIVTNSLPDGNSSQIRVSITGCIGLCALEPIVQVEISGQPPVTYGKVTPSVAQRILSDHIGKGLVVQEHVVEYI
jgi:NADP-reducing hydrogenase subunit HndB